MMSGGPTQHALIRMAQRAIRDHDRDLIIWIGTEVEGGYLVREKDFQMFDQGLKQLRDHASRLVGKRVVVEGGRVVTAYHARPAKERWLLRRADQRAMDGLNPGAARRRKQRERHRGAERTEEMSERDDLAPHH